MVNVLFSLHKPNTKCSAIVRKLHEQDMTLHEKLEKSKQVAKYQCYNRSVCFLFCIFSLFFFLQHARHGQRLDDTSRTRRTCLHMHFLAHLTDSSMWLFTILYLSVRKKRLFSMSLMTNNCSRFFFSLDISWNCHSLLKKQRIVQVTEFWKPLFNCKKDIVSGLFFFILDLEKKNFILFTLKRMFSIRKKWLDSLNWMEKCTRWLGENDKNLEQIKAFSIRRFIEFYCLKTERKWSEWPSTAIRYGLVQCYNILLSKPFFSTVIFNNFFQMQSMWTKANS